MSSATQGYLTLYLNFWANATKSPQGLSVKLQYHYSSLSRYVDFMEIVWQFFRWVMWSSCTLELIPVGGRGLIPGQWGILYIYTSWHLVFCLHVSIHTMSTWMLIILFFSSRLHLFTNNVFSHFSTCPLACYTSMLYMGLVWEKLTTISKSITILPNIVIIDKKGLKTCNNRISLSVI